MLHDVLRYLVRSGPRTPVNIQRALMMIDGDELGYQSVEDYEKHGHRLPRTDEEAGPVDFSVLKGDPNARP